MYFAVRYHSWSIPTIIFVYGPIVGLIILLIVLAKSNSSSGRSKPSSGTTGKNYFAWIKKINFWIVGIALGVLALIIILIIVFSNKRSAVNQKRDINATYVALKITTISKAPVVKTTPIVIDSLKEGDDTLVLGNKIIIYIDPLKGWSRAYILPLGGPRKFATVTFTSVSNPSQSFDDDGHGTNIQKWWAMQKGYYIVTLLEPSNLKIWFRWADYKKFND